MISLHIAIVSGASRQGRQSHKVAEYLFSLLNERTNVKAELIDIRLAEIPHYQDGDLRSFEVQQKHTAYSKSLQKADCIILVSPEYNGGMSGSLKNFLDHFRSEYGRTVFGLASVSSGSMGGLNAMQQMVAFVSYVGGFLSNSRLLVSHINNSFDDSNKIIDAQLEKNAVRFANDLVWLGTAIKVQRQEEIKVP